MKESEQFKVMTDSEGVIYLVGPLGSDPWNQQRLVLASTQEGQHTEHYRQSIRTDYFSLLGDTRDVTLSYHTQENHWELVTPDSFSVCLHARHVFPLIREHLKENNNEQNNYEHHD